MFNLMLEFNIQMLSAVSAWLGSEPMIYIFGLVIACFAVKWFSTLLKW